MKESNIGPSGLIYGKYQTGRNTWTIMTFDHPQFIYLLIGEEKALLIDTLYGYGDLREIVESITDKPLIVANTHGHFDHTGGNAFWEDCYMSEISTKDCKNAFGEEMTAHFNQMPHPDYTCHVLKDGDIIDLGGKKVEVMAIGAHHPGSLAFLDLDERILYAGDELEAGQVLCSVSKVPQHLENMKKLKARYADFDYINSAHNGTHLVKDYIDDFIKLDEGIIDGSIKPMDSTVGFGCGENPDNKRYNYGRAYIVDIKGWIS